MIVRGEERKILVCVEQKYKLWVDRLTRRWRWALRVWPDNGYSTANYGACHTLEEAVAACEAHDKMLAGLGTQ